MKFYYLLVPMALILSTLTGCGRKEKPLPPSPPEGAAKPPEQIEITGKGNKIYLPLKGGKQVWEAEAETIKGDFIGGTGEMFELTCRLWENDKTLLSGQAGKASYDKAKQQIVLSEGAKADWPDKQAKISADRIIWQLESRQLVAEGRVQLVQNGQTLSGNHLQVDFNLKSFVVTD